MQVCNVYMLLFSSLNVLCLKSHKATQCTQFYVLSHSSRSNYRVCYQDNNFDILCTGFSYTEDTDI